MSALRGGLVAQPRGRGEGAHRKILGCIVATSLVLKLLLLIPAHRVQPINDSADYVSMAMSLASTGQLSALGRPPGYPLALAGVFWLGEQFGFPVSGPSEGRGNPLEGLTRLDLARLAQVIWSTITVGLVYLLALECFDTRTALVAAALCAFYPDLVGYSHLLWSETLFILLTVSWVLLLLRGLRRDRLGLAVGAGVALGLSVWMRQTGLFFAALAAVCPWLFGVKPQRRALRFAAAVALSTALVVLPIAVRNTLVYGHVVLVAPQAGWALLFGAAPDVFAEARVLRQRQYPSSYELDEAAGARAREIIRADPAAWVYACLTRNVPGFWHPGFDGAIMHLSARAGYGSVPTWLARAVIAAIVLSYLAVAILAIAGATLARERRLTILVAGMTATLVCVHAASVAFPRHRLPLMAFATIFAGFLVSRRRAEWRLLLTRGRVAAALAAVLLFLTLVASNNLQPLGRAWSIARVATGPISAIVDRDTPSGDLFAAEVTPGGARQCKSIPTRARTS